MNLMEIDWQQFYNKAIAWLITSGLRILIVLVLTLIAVKIARFFISRYFDKRKKCTFNVEVEKRADTLSTIFSSAAIVVIIIVGIIMVLDVLKIPVAPLLASAGIVGVAVGFGAQHLVQDVISGVFIYMDDQIRVGDVVQIADKGGLVEKMNLRMVVLRDLAGNVHFIRNGQIDVVTNMTKEYSRYVFDIGVAYRENVDEVIEIIKKVDEELRSDETFKQDILEPIEILGLDKFADSAVVIKARTKTKPIKQWAVAREFNRRLKIAFDELNIEIPFPHVTLYPGQEKDGSAPPLKLNVQNNNT